MLAIMVMRRFEESEDRIRSDFRAEMSLLENRLNTRIDYRFDSLSNRIDDLVLNKISRDEHRALVTRVSTMEEKIGIAD